VADGMVRLAMVVMLPLKKEKDEILAKKRRVVV
jgi:hypothetical protein